MTTMTLQSVSTRSARALRFTAALVSTSLQSSVASRSAFSMQVAFMALNNLMFLSTWFILFARFERVGDFGLPDMLLLFGVSAAGFGLAAVFCGGALELSRTIADGGLDALLCQPKSVLVRAVAARSLASGWGDVASGVLLIAFADGAPLALVPLAVLLAAVAFVATACIAHSAAFWLGRVESLARAFFELVVLFTLYPPSLFGSGVRVLLFTLLPAGVVAYLPVELLRAPSVASVATATLAVAAFAVLAWFVFTAGLRRYESGSRFG
jgi:ABC-2 type transport system permease protein